MARTISGNNGQISLNPATDNPTYVTGNISSTATVSLYAPAGANWTVTNTGSILDPLALGVGVYFASGNARFVNGVTSGGGGYVGAGQIGVLFGASSVGTVLNFATIKANTYKITDGVNLANGGTVTNGSTSVTGALIAAYGSDARGVALSGVGTVRNFGTISGAGTASGYGVATVNGGTIINGVSNSTAALISGTREGIVLYGSTLTSTVINYGTISGGNLDAIRDLVAADLTVVNSGTLSGPASIHFGSATNNRLIARPGAVFQGVVEMDNGGSLTIELATGSGAGTIGGFGSNFTGFNALTVDSGAQWTITGSNSIASGVSLMNSGTLTNAGTLVDAGTLTNAGVVNGSGVLSASGRVVNSGTITNTVTLTGGAYLGNTGNVVAGSGAGVVATGAVTIVNSGTIDPAGPGVYLTHGGTLTNSAVGYIGGGVYGVKINGSYGATVTNAGTVSGTIGITVVDSATAGQTIIDSGTIAGGGGTAVAFGAGNDLLKLTPSTSLSIQGTVDGGGGTNTLEFSSAASKGTLTGLGADFVNFTNGTIDSGAYWVFAGTNTIASGVILTNSGTLDVAGTLVNGGQINGHDYHYTLRLSPGGYFDNLAGAVVTRRISSNNYIDPVVLGLAGGASTITNRGTIFADPAANTNGIGLAGDGKIVNGATDATAALISAPVAIYNFQHTHATVANYGSVIGGIDINGYGTIVNGAIGSTAALIEGTTSNGVFFGSPAGTIINFGTIISTYANAYGVNMAYGSGGTVIDSGTITGGRAAIRFGSGSRYGPVGNNLVKLYPGAVLSGGVTAAGSGNVLEFASAAGAGTITALGTGYVGFGTVNVDTGAQWVIIGTASIAGGVTLTNAGTLTNSGTLTNAGTLTDTGSLINSGSIAGTVTLSSGGFLSNSAGTISGAGTAVAGALAAATILNTGLITASSGTAIVLGAGGTITDAGTIAGSSTAINFGGSGANLLILEHGYTLTGAVRGSGSAGATNTLELLGSAGSPVTASYNGLSLSNFVTVKFAPGADYVTLKITDDVTLPGTIAGFTALHDVIDLTALSDAANDATARLDTLTNVVTVVGDNGSVQLHLDSEDYSSITFKARNDGSSGTEVFITAVDTTPPVTTSASLTVAENAAATAIGILAPSDPDDAAATLTVMVAGLPSDGTVASGSTAVTVGEVLSVAQLTALTFTPTANIFGQSSSLSYTVADPAGNSATGSATLAIGPDDTPLVTTPASLTVAENAAATAIGILAPSDPDNPASALTVMVIGLPSDGTVASGGTALGVGQVLSVAQLTALTFTPTANAFGKSSSLSYNTVADPAGNSATGSATLAIGPDDTPPVTTPASLTVAENAAAMAIGILAPSDPDNPASALTVMVIGLPSDGTVLSGGTAVTVGEVLTVAQLTELTFTPTATIFGQSSSLSYSVADPAGNSATGSATLAIGPDDTPPVTTPASLTVAENAASTAIGITAPSDPDNPAAALTVMVSGLPSDGTVISGNTALTLNQILTVAQLTALTFTPADNAFSQSSSLGYTVADTAGNSTTGSATLAIGAQMASPTGGRFIIGPPAGFASVTASISDGIEPIFPTSVSGNFNVEVFTAAGLTTLPILDSSFQAGIIDPGGHLVSPGFLTGTTLRLFTGDYAVTDSVTGATQTAADFILGNGNQTVTGGSGDTLQGGSGSQLLIGGSGPTTVFGAPGNSVVAGAGSTYIDGTAGKMAIGVGSGRSDSIVGTSSNNPITGPATGPDTIIGGSAAVQIQSLGKGDLISFGNQTGNATINATIGNIAATLGGGAASVFGGVGDTINLGSVGQYADAGAGKMTIKDGSAGVDSVFGSNLAGGGGTILGGSASLSFDAQSGGGDLINLAGSSGNATINGFSAGGTQLASVNDTIMAGTESDSVWGGPGDRIGVGTSSTAGGTHIFDHSTSIAGAAMSFGTNDSVAGSSTAKVTVTNFNSGTDSLFYQNESAATNTSIVATSTTTGGNTTFTLPDGTVMTLIGVASINFGMFKS